MLQIACIDDTFVSQIDPTGASHARAELPGQGEIESCPYIQIPHGCCRNGRHRLTAKLAILKAWEADERALLRAEDEGMGGGEHAHLHKVQAALAQLSKELCSTNVTERTLRVS